MFSRVFLFASALLTLVAGCPVTQCAQSADIQVTVVPDPEIDATMIANLHVSLSVNGAKARTRVIDLTQPVDKNNLIFILRPDVMPKTNYTVTVTIEAMTGGAQLLAFGSDSEQVLPIGCNKLEVHLGALPPTGGPTDMSLPFGSDGFTPPDGDMFTPNRPPPDMAGCIGGMPDEDNDVRANSCDLCPADYDPNPVDSDGDGLPNACDPDPNTKSNSLVYFDPFDTNSGHWMGTFTMPTGMSYLQIDSTDTPLNTSMNVSNSVDLLPLNVRAQTFVSPTTIYFSQSVMTANADVAIFIGDGKNPTATGTNGVLCQVRLDRRNGAMNDAIRIISYVNGSATSCNTTPTDSATSPMCTITSGSARFTFSLQNESLYRLRLTQRGNIYTCEVYDGTNTYSPATLTATSGPTQNIVLQETNLQAQFNSVVAETALSQ